MGSTTAGHYYLFVKPGRNESWYKIDDERVEPCSFDLVQQEGYGTGVADEPSAYLLVYIRADSYDQLLADVDLSGYTPPETIGMSLPSTGMLPVYAYLQCICINRATSASTCEKAPVCPFAAQEAST